MTTTNTVPDHPTDMLITTNTIGERRWHYAQTSFSRHERRCTLYFRQIEITVAVIHGEVEVREIRGTDRGAAFTRLAEEALQAEALEFTEAARRRRDQGLMGIHLTWWPEN